MAAMATLWVFRDRIAQNAFNTFADKKSRMWSIAVSSGSQHALVATGLSNYSTPPSKFCLLPQVCISPV